MQLTIQFPSTYKLSTGLCLINYKVLDNGKCIFDVLSHLFLDILMSLPGNFNDFHCHIFFGEIPERGYTPVTYIQKIVLPQL